MPVAFDTSGMEQYDERTWFDPRTGDQVSLTYIGLVPDLPAGLDELPLLRHRLALETAEVGALIEAHVVFVDKVPTLFQLLKVPIPNQDSGQAFIAAFTVPKATCSVVLRIQCAEGPTTGVREATVFGQVGVDNYVRPHPYAPDLTGRLPWHVADDAQWDGQFPDHPLSRARAWAHRTMATARIDPGFAQLPPFRPGATETLPRAEPAGANGHAVGPVEGARNPSPSPSPSPKPSPKPSPTPRQSWTAPAEEPEPRVPEPPIWQAPPPEEPEAEPVTNGRQARRATGRFSDSGAGGRHTTEEPFAPFDGGSVIGSVPREGGPRRRRAEEEGVGAEDPDQGKHGGLGFGGVGPESVDGPDLGVADSGSREFGAEDPGFRNSGVVGAGTEPDIAKHDTTDSTNAGTEVPGAWEHGGPDLNATSTGTAKHDTTDSDARSAGAKDPRGRHHGTPDLGMVTPGADLGAEDPGFRNAGVMDAGTTEPDLREPDTTDSDATAAGAEDPRPARNHSTPNFGITDPGVMDATPEPDIANPGTTDSDSGVRVFEGWEHGGPGNNATKPRASLGAEDPGVRDPGVMDAGVTKPDITDSDNTDSEAANAGATDPGVWAHDIPNLGTTKPDTMYPGVTSPDDTTPSPAVPGVITASPTDLGATNPVVTSQSAEQSRVETRSVESHGVEPHGVKGRHFENPGVEKPSTESHRAESHHFGNLSLENASLENPSLENPSAENPRIENHRFEHPSVENPNVVGLGVDNHRVADLGAEKPNAEKPSVVGLGTESSNVVRLVGPGARFTDLAAAPLDTADTPAATDPVPAGSSATDPRDPDTGQDPLPAVDPLVPRPDTADPAITRLGVSDLLTTATPDPHTGAHRGPAGPKAPDLTPPDPIPTAAPAAVAPPVSPGDVMHTVLLGLPIGGYLPLWQTNEITYWRMTDPDVVRDRLGVGLESRSEIDDQRFREAAMLSPDKHTLFLMDRFRDRTGNLGGTTTQLVPANEDEALAAADDRAMSELYRWLGEVVLAAADRGEFVAVETGGWHVPREPAVLIMLRTDGEEWHSVVETSPVPVGAPVWRDQQPVDGDSQLLVSPATEQTLRAAGLLTRFAVATWPLHPFQLGLSFGPTPTLGEMPAGKVNSHHG